MIRTSFFQAINCSVHLQIHSDQFTLFIRNPTYTKVEERLQRSDDDVESAENWRRLQIREPREQISDQQLYFLLEPIYFTMSGGEIQNARVAKDDPVWSVNFKKALVLQLQTKLGSQLEENRVRTVNGKDHDLSSTDRFQKDRIRPPESTPSSYNQGLGLDLGPSSKTYRIRNAY